MVCAGVGAGERQRLPNKSMAMGPERSKPLHNFDLPCLKWGNQKYLRCMKPSPFTGDEASGVDRRSPAPITRRTELDKRQRNLKTRIESEGEEGIEAVREKLMFDLKTAANKMKETIFRNDERIEQEEEEEEEIEEEEEEEEEEEQSPVATTTVEATTRPWNLRTRRAACKAPIPIGGGKGLRIEEKKVSYSPLRSENNGVKSPRLRGGVAEKKGKERAKFAVSLSRKEIENDFMDMLGRRPPRRPKKRPRNVQKQLDTLFPGLWMTEITADFYKVPEIPENGKR